MIIKIDIDDGISKYLAIPLIADLLLVENNYSWGDIERDGYKAKITHGSKGNIFIHVSKAGGR